MGQRQFWYYSVQFFKFQNTTQMDKSMSMLWGALDSFSNGVTVISRLMNDLQATFPATYRTVALAYASSALTDESKKTLARMEFFFGTCMAYSDLWTIKDRYKNAMKKIGDGVIKLKLEPIQNAMEAVVGGVDITIDPPTFNRLPAAPFTQDQYMQVSLMHEVTHLAGTKDYGYWNGSYLDAAHPFFGVRWLNGDPLQAVQPTHRELMNNADSYTWFVAYGKTWLLSTKAIDAYVAGAPILQYGGDQP